MIILLLAAGHGRERAEQGHGDARWIAESWYQHTHQLLLLIGCLLAY